MTETHHAVRRRLTVELGDLDFASHLVDTLDPVLWDRLAAVDIATTPLLSYRPRLVSDDQIDSLWILAFGYRVAGGADGVEIRGEVPRMDRLEPGPINEELARQAAAFVEGRAVPIIAQWEVANALAALDVPDVLAVEPDETDDGEVVYLSTAGVLEKGLRLTAEAGTPVGRPGLLAHADHAGRCLLTAAATGLDAVVPESVELPGRYDEGSGQVWTRSRAAFLPLDLMARAHL